MLARACLVDLSGEKMILFGIGFSSGCGVCRKEWVVGCC